MSKVKEALAPNDYKPASERYLSVDAGMVRFDTERLLQAFPELADDEELRGDMLSGETRIDEVLTRLFLAWRHREELASGAKAIKADLDIREKRNTAAAKKLKDIALTIMETADLPKRELPVVTLSVSAGRKRVVVDDVNALPQGAFTTERKAIAAKDLETMILAERAGQFPGAHLEIGDDYLTARAK